MRGKVMHITAVFAIGMMLAYLGAAATPPMRNYAPAPASLYTVLIAALLCGVFLASVSDQAVQSIAAGAALGMIFFGGVRAWVIAWSLTHQQVPFTLYELAISDSVLQYTIHRGMFMYLASGLVGMLGAALTMVILPDQFRA
jgi:uncharacterized membrane protein